MRQVDDPLSTAICLEALAWTYSDSDPYRAIVLMSASRSLARAVGSSSIPFPNLLVHHDEYIDRANETLSEHKFEAARQQGESLGFEDALAYALEEQARPTPLSTDQGTGLTKRELQVAGLVAEGLTNKSIAARLVISQRTARGHVEHILTKLGFTSRAQIAAWAAEQGHD